MENCTPDITAKMMRQVTDRPNTQKGTNLWMTIKLSPNVTQSIEPYDGSYWNKIESQNKLCYAGINTCAYHLLKQKNIELPQM